MSAKSTATRAEAMAAAADKYAGEFLPFWDAEEYMRGICEVLADTFGTSDPENARSEIWEEISTAHKAATLREKAEKIAAQIAADVTGCDMRHGSPVGDLEASLSADQIDGADIYAALTAAALAALTEKENAR